MNMFSTLACNRAISWNLSLVLVGRAYSLCFCLSSCKESLMKEPSILCNISTVYPKTYSKGLKKGFGTG